MPFINSKVSVKVTSEQKVELKTRIKNTIALLIAFSMILSVTIMPITAIDSHAAQDGVNVDMAWEVLDIVNSERAANGLQPLTMDKGLMDAAQIRANEIVSVFSHTRPDGTSCFTVLSSDYQYGSSGENIAAGQQSAADVMNSWMNSPGHRANILNGDYQSIGIACVYIPGSQYRYHWVQLFHSKVVNAATKGNAPKEPVQTDDGTIPMYRVYNPNSGEHFYTSSFNELTSICNVGWSYEGVAWYAPASGDNVYRMYNPNTGDHHYTLNPAERDMLVNVGWNYEGVCWYSSGDTPVYRAYNPYATAGSHHYAISSGEIASLVSVGWKDEGIAWYGVR